MKILAIGDFHGRFPTKLKEAAKKVDLIISVGDYPRWRLRDKFFECCWRSERELWEVVGKRVYKNKRLMDWEDAKNVMKIITSFGKPVLTTLGNYDDSGLHDSLDLPKKKSKWEWVDVEKKILYNLLKKFSNIKRIDYRAKKIGNLVFIAGLGHSSPGKVKSKSYKRHRAKLEKLFKKYSKENKEGRLIFVNHTTPYNTKLDKIRDKKAPEKVQGKHYGSKIFRRLIDKYQPTLAIAGHFHENQGKCMLGKTLIINPGAAVDSKCAIVDFDEIKGRVKKVEFVK